MSLPKVAILSAREEVSSKLPSSFDAAVLCKMADRGQITGGVLDGPLGFDVAVSEAAAKAKCVESPVAGYADILVVPDLEAGAILVKQLEYMSDAQVAGLVVGAECRSSRPVVPTTPWNVLASCALALLLARNNQANASSPPVVAIVNWSEAGSGRRRTARAVRTIAVPETETCDNGHSDRIAERATMWIIQEFPERSPGSLTGNRNRFYGVLESGLRDLF